MDNWKVVHVYLGDFDPYTVAAEVTHQVCMATGYYFLPVLIVGDSHALKKGLSTLCCYPEVLGDLWGFFMVYREITAFLNSGVKGNNSLGFSCFAPSSVLLL